MLWVGFALFGLFAFSLWRTWTSDDRGPDSDCGVSVLDWFELF